MDLKHSTIRFPPQLPAAAAAAARHLTASRTTPEQKIPIFQVRRMTHLMRYNHLRSVNRWCSGLARSTPNYLKRIPSSNQRQGSCSITVVAAGLQVGSIVKHWRSTDLPEQMRNPDLLLASALGAAQLKSLLSYEEGSSQSASVLHPTRDMHGHCQPTTW